MPATTNQFAKAISLVDYQPAFISGADTVSWDWKKLATLKTTNRKTEQVFSWAGLPIPAQTNELQPIYYADMAELPATTFTMTKYSLATSFSYELLKYDQHVRDLMAKAGKQMGNAHSYLKDVVIANIFNNATTATVYDSVALCGTHTTRSGDSVDNALAAASLSFDNLWSQIDYFSTALVNHSGMKFTSKPKYLVLNPIQAKTVEKILETDREPDQGDWNKNTLLKRGIQPLYCPHLTSTTEYFLVGENFADDLWVFTVEEPQFDMEDDFDRMGTKYRSYQIFGAGVKDYFEIVENPGA